VYMLYAQTGRSYRLKHRQSWSAPKRTVYTVADGI
jgi:hypothetical protein